MVSDGGGVECEVGELDDSGSMGATMSMLVDEGLVASSTLERATLTRRPHAKHHHHPTSGGGVGGKVVGGSSGSSGVFWTLVAVLLVLALSNLTLTFFAMGVLRLGVGMESIEFITGPQRMVKFYGVADLGVVQQQDGALTSYAAEPLTLTADQSQVSIGVNTVRPSPAVHVAQHSIHIVNVKSMQVVEPGSGAVVFTTARPSFTLPRGGVNNLKTTRTIAARISSPAYHALSARGDTTIRVKGNEGVVLHGRTIEWNADQDIFLRSLNGSLVLDGGSAGIFVEVNTLPLAGPVDHSRDRGQYKLCVCHRTETTAARSQHSSGMNANRHNIVEEENLNTSHRSAHLFRVPVPADNMHRSKDRQINCASFTNPCMMM